MEYIGSQKNRSISDDGKYIVAVKEAISSYKAFCSFKRDPRYTEILEHTTFEQGLKYLEIIKNQTPELFERINDFKENDVEGGAITELYNGIGLISPSTLRYLKVTSDILKIFGNNIQGNFVEIGVGYGGQLFIIDKVFRYDEYHLFDLPPVLELASKYLECYILNNCYRTYTLNQYNNRVDYELAISNYAFSELPSKLQIMYIKKIFSRSKRGYLTMNSGLVNSAFQHDKLSLSDLRILLPRFDVIDEKPNTHPGNYIIIWGY